jgi:hypothetical protein
VVWAPRWQVTIDVTDPKARGGSGGSSRKS